VSTTLQPTIPQQLFSKAIYTLDSPTLFSILGGGVYVNIGVSDVSNPGGMSCSPYRPFAV